MPSRQQIEAWCVSNRSFFGGIAVGTITVLPVLMMTVGAAWWFVVFEALVSMLSAALYILAGRRHAELNPSETSKR